MLAKLNGRIVTPNEPQNEHQNEPQNALQSALQKRLEAVAAMILANGSIAIHVPEKNNVGELNGGLSGGLNVPVNGTLNGTLIKNIKESLNASQSKVFDFIMRNPGCMGKEIIGALDMPRDTFNKIIRSLFEKKIIERRGSKKTGGYWVKKELTSTNW